MAKDGPCLRVRTWAWGVTPKPRGHMRMPRHWFLTMPSYWLIMPMQWGTSWTQAGGKPEALIQQALKIDPLNVKALMLAGTVAFNRNNFARAAKDWELARANLPSDTDPEMTQQLVAAIEEAKSHLGGGQETVACIDGAGSSAGSTGQADRTTTCDQRHGHHGAGPCQ